MSQIPTPTMEAIDAALGPVAASEPSQTNADMKRLMEKPLAPIKFNAGSYAVEDMSQCYRLARHYIAAGMVPRGLEGRGQDETLGRVAIAIELGQRFGWTPAQSLQSIMVVNGRPCLWSDGPMSLVLNSKLLLDFTATIEGTGDDRVAVFTAVRLGKPEPITRTVRFGVADAKKAGLWGKSGPWTNYPERMMMYRARAFCLRDLFADVLGGMGIGEENDSFGVDAQETKTEDLAARVREIEIVDATKGTT